jgi:cofilin
MSSGVKLDPECVEVFNDFKLKHSDKFLIFGFNENATKIVLVNREASKTNAQPNYSWDNLVKSFPPDDVRYAVVDVDYNSAEGSKTTMVFITWAPETASIKKRMLMASSKDVLKNALVGCNTQVQATSYPDLDIKNVFERIKGAIF